MILFLAANPRDTGRLALDQEARSIHLEHQGEVWSAAFSPNGARVVTASSDKTARVWNVLPDTGTLADWSRIAERSPFVLNEHGVLVRRSELRVDAASSR